MAKTTKRKNPSDLTIRNLRAAKKRESSLTKRVVILSDLVGELSASLNHAVSHLQARIRALERIAHRNNETLGS